MGGLGLTRVGWLRLNAPPVPSPWQGEGTGGGVMLWVRFSGSNSQTKPRQETGKKLLEIG
ncbi:hypothetical protein Oscil6304_5783 [Oscillatoria acuminata PCC 6304]|uniref:Uncharacterized protein n=1 Tax=Oscillatoria acuminata PCC 6304 TaxID=56110 RepID=K9TTB9_9CYAN|nr:hypothetical protein Oscil6304_5783 [Oscillatoria acuminata PCC 6304]